MSHFSSAVTLCAQLTRALSAITKFLIRFYFERTFVDVVDVTIQRQSIHYTMVCCAHATVTLLALYLS